MDRHLRAQTAARIRAAQAEHDRMGVAACLVLAAGLLLVASLALLPGPAKAQTNPAPPAATRRAEIVNMVRQDCGSCHGMTLRGGLGPSLEARTLAERDAAQLQYVILNGRRGTPMPPWKDFLTEAEAAWVVELLQAGTLDGVRHAR